VAGDLASRLRAAHQVSSAAFNRADLDQALGALPEDLEWHPPSEDADHTVYRGPAEVKGWFEEMRSVFDQWRIEPQDVEQISESTVIVHHVISGTSRAAGIPVDVHTHELWEFAPLDADSHAAWQFVGMRPVRARQFPSRVTELAAAAG
jgi:ketosteroid isomerase-like protein